MVVIKNANELNFRADLLREAIRSAGLSQSKLAKAMGINSKTFSEKMNGKTKWNLTEIQYLYSTLNNFDVCEVFKFN